MPQVSKIKKMSFLISFCLAMAPIGMAQAAEALALPQWKALHYRLSLLFVSAEADITIRQASNQELQKNLLNPPGVALKIADQPLYQLSITTDNLGRKSDTQVWYSGDFKMIQLSRFDSGKRYRRKVFRYLPDGFWSYQRSPKNDDEIEDESRWSVEETKSVQKPAELKSVEVIEDSLLFHLVSVLPLRKKGDSYQYYSYINDAVFLNRLQVVGKKDVDVDFVEKFPDHDKWREGETELVHIKVHATAVDAKNQEDFEIMGLKGDLSLFVDPNTGVLVQLSGHVDYLGQVDIALYKVEF